MFYPNLFFDLSSYEHPLLFSSGADVWEALKALESYLNEACLGVILGKVSKEAILKHEHRISIGKGSLVEAGAVIEGPCLIGEDVMIRPGAYIRPNTVIGNQCVVGHGTEVKHSIFLDRAKAAHFNYVGNSILGHDVNLGAGAICANYRLDHQEVRGFALDKRFNTGMRKFGAILGDGTQVGCNSVLNPGILIKRGTQIRPCTSVENSNL